MRRQPSDGPGRRLFLGGPGPPLLPTSLRGLSRPRRRATWSPVGAHYADPSPPSASGGARYVIGGAREIQLTRAGLWYLAQLRGLTALTFARMGYIGSPLADINKYITAELRTFLCTQVKRRQGQGLAWAPSGFEWARTRGGGGLDPAGSAACAEGGDTGRAVVSMVRGVPGSRVRERVMGGKKKPWLRKPMCIRGDT